jgi:hypothetical protein
MRPITPDEELGQPAVGAAITITLGERAEATLAEAVKVATLGEAVRSAFVTQVVYPHLPINILWRITKHS